MLCVFNDTYAAAKQFLYVTSFLEVCIQIEIFQWLQ
jgi:hypothetical protein